jgi:hypothetical protein
VGYHIVKGGGCHLCDRGNIIEKSDQSDAQVVLASFLGACAAREDGEAAKHITARCRATIHPQWQRVPPVRLRRRGLGSSRPFSNPRLIEFGFFSLTLAEANHRTAAAAAQLSEITSYGRFIQTRSG